MSTSLGAIVISYIFPALYLCEVQRGARLQLCSALPDLYLHDKALTINLSNSIVPRYTNILTYRIAVEEATPGPGSAAEASQALWRKLQRVLQHPRDASVFALAGPSLLALAADPLLSMVDTACVGQIDASSLAALGVNTGLFSVAFLIFNFLGTATTPLIARAAARGDKEAAGAVAREVLETMHSTSLPLAFSSGVSDIAR